MNEVKSLELSHRPARRQLRMPTESVIAGRLVALYTVMLKWKWQR